jgi:hypothetical protein
MRGFTSGATNIVVDGGALLRRSRITGQYFLQTVGLGKL